MEKVIDTKSLKEIPEQKWDDDLENLMKSWGEKAAGNKELHSQSARKWQIFSNRMYLPLMVLTTVGGVSSIGSSGMNHNAYIMIGIGVMNITASILTGLVKYHRVEEKIQEHLFACKSFGSFYRTVTLELTLARDNRTPPEVFNLWAKNEYDKMLQDAPMLSDHIINDYKQRHRDDENKPDVVADNYVINIHGREKETYFKEL